MRLTLAQIEKAVEAMQPGPVTVLAAYPDGSRRRLTAQEYIEDPQADLISVTGSDMRIVMQVIDRYIDLDGEIAIK